ASRAALPRAEGTAEMPRDDRRMTFIVIPHGGRDLNSRSFEVSYRRLRVAGALLLVGAILWGASVGAGLYLSSRAARVPMLEREVAQLRGENVRVAELADALRRLEAQYEQVRAMFGADRAGQ